MSDAREQESALSLNVNLFLTVLGFRFTTSQIPCHAWPNAQAARNDDVRKKGMTFLGMVLDGFRTGCGSPILYNSLALSLKLQISLSIT